MKLLYSHILSLLLFVSTAVSQESKITLIRGLSGATGGIQLVVYMDGKPLVHMDAGTHFSTKVPAGKHAFSTGKPDTTEFFIEVQSGQERMILIEILRTPLGVVSLFNEVDRETANALIEVKKFSLIAPENAIPPRKLSRYGLVFGFGPGFERIPVATTTEGDDATISFGGGVVVGAEIGREITPYFDLLAQFNYMVAELAPVVENGDVKFTRWQFSVRPSLILPIGNGEKSRIKVGPGLDYFTGAKMKFSLGDVPGGFDGTWKYNSGLGWHMAFAYETVFGRDMLGSFGLRYTKTDYSYKPSSNAAAFPTDRKLVNGDGSGVEFLMTIVKAF